MRWRGNNRSRKDMESIQREICKYLPVSAVQFSQKAKKQRKRHVFEEVFLGADGDVERVMIVPLAGRAIA